MIALIVVASIFGTVSVAIFIITTIYAVDNTEVWAGCLPLAMMLAFVTGTIITAANYEHSAAMKAAEAAAVIQTLPRHAEKP